MHGLRFAPTGVLSAQAVILAAALTLSPVTVAGADPERRATTPAEVELKSDATASEKPFSIQEQNGTSWLIKPNGERFFSRGVCSVNMGTPRTAFDPDKPVYAAWQHYSEPNRWATATLKRLESWRFTTVGAWSDFEVLRQCRDAHVAFAPVLHVGSTAGAPWWDMWDPQIIGRMERVAQEKMSILGRDPRVIGYYSDNEMGWWNATLFKMTLEHPPTSGQRRRLTSLLRETYHDNWPEVLADFESEAVAGWEELDQRGMLYLRPGGNGIHTMRRFLGLMAERYYSLVHEIIHKYDQRALILGDRYQTFYYPEVARASAPFVDAVSTNLDASWNDGTFPRFYLETLHALTGKPIIISEFYMSARENRSGNKNDHGIFPVVATQAERAIGFRKTLEALVKVPYIIGADWFQYYDEPPHGRYDGENFNFGLVDIKNRPYRELVLQNSALDLAALKVAPPATRLDASRGVPRAPRNPLGQFSPMLALRDWDRERGFIKPATDFPLADLFVCWNDESVFLGLYAQDVVEDAFYRDKLVPNDERAEWTVSIGGTSHPIRALIGARAEPVVNEPAVRIVNLSGLNLDVRNIAAMELPAKLFSKERFRAGDSIDLASTLLTHCKAYRVEWEGTFILQNNQR
jgi:hypothetical protein